MTIVRAGLTTWQMTRAGFAFYLGNLSLLPFFEILPAAVLYLGVVIKDGKRATRIYVIWLILTKLLSPSKINTCGIGNALSSYFV